MFTSLKIGPERCQVVGYKASLVCAFLWSYYWNHPFTHAVSGIYGRQSLPRLVFISIFISIVIVSSNSTNKNDDQ